MGLFGYLRHSVWDFLLCACASSALCYTCLIAFVSTHPVQDFPAIVIVACTAVTAVLFVVAFNLYTAVAGSALLVVATCVAAAIGWSGSPAESVFDDVVGNYAYLVVLIMVCTVLVFALSRRKIPCIGLLVGGLLACSVMEYLYWDGKFLATALFAVAASALLAYRNYRMGLAGSDSDRLMFGSAATLAAAIPCVSIALAFAVFAVFVAPLDPPHLIVKLLTRHVQLEQEEVRGVGDEVSIRNDLLFSILTDGTIEATSGSEGKDDEQEESQQDDSAPDDQTQDTGGATFGLDNTQDESAQALGMNVPDYWPILAALAVLLAIASTIAVRFMLRRRRYNRIRALPATGQVRAFYLYFLKSFGKMKVVQPDRQTLNEYAEAMSATFATFEEQGAASQAQPSGLAGGQSGARSEFAALTDSYSRCVYGADDASAQQAAGAFDRYYQAFHRHARRFVGRFRYLALFFRI